MGVFLVAIFLVSSCCFGEELKNIQFILLPGNRTSVVGLDVVFKCKAGYQNGSSVPVIWSKYGIENLPSRYTTGVEFLLLPKVRLSDSGWYICSVEPSIESFAYLNVLAAGTVPHFTRSIPSSYTIITPSDTAVIFCSAFGIPRPKIKWKKDKLDLTSDPSTKGPYAKEGTLHFKSAESSHSGSYTCVAENVLGSVSQDVTVNIVTQDLEALPISRTWWKISVICVVSLVSLLVLICVMRTCYLCIRYRKRVAIGSAKVVTNEHTSEFMCRWPSKWDIHRINELMSSDKKCQVVDLHPVSNKLECSYVLRKFTETYTPIKSIRIQRIQNPTLYAQYSARKAIMDQTNSIANERMLFHGCAFDVVDKINNGGFNRSYAGKHGTAFGNGTYFAVNARYSASDVYSPPDVHGRKHMYLAKVLTGQYTKGNKDLKNAPAKDQNNPAILYDSVVDDVIQPSIFVIFQDAQMYPEYHIDFC